MPSYPSVASKSEIAFYHGKVGDDNTLMMRKHHLSHEGKVGRIWVNQSPILVDLQEVQTLLRIIIY